MLVKSPVSEALVRELFHPGRVPALLLLYGAQVAGLEAGADPREFALKLPLLVQKGIKLKELRWLLAKKIAELHIELEPLSKGRRRFRMASDHQLTEHSCLVLTTLGLD